MEYRGIFFFEVGRRRVKDFNFCLLSFFYVGFKFVFIVRKRCYLNSIYIFYSVFYLIVKKIPSIFYYYLLDSSCHSEKKWNVAPDAPKDVRDGLQEIAKEMVLFLSYS